MDLILRTASPCPSLDLDSLYLPFHACIFMKEVEPEQAMLGSLWSGLGWPLQPGLARKPLLLLLPPLTSHLWSSPSLSYYLQFAAHTMLHIHAWAFLPYAVPFPSLSAMHTRTHAHTHTPSTVRILWTLKPSWCFQDGPFLTPPSSVHRAILAQAALYNTCSCCLSF